VIYSAGRRELEGTGMAEWDSGWSGNGIPAGAGAGAWRSAEQRRWEWRRAASVRHAGCSHVRSVGRPLDPIRVRGEAAGNEIALTSLGTPVHLHSTPVAQQLR
jgi:hypothetical protein